MALFLDLPVSVVEQGFSISAIAAIGQNINLVDLGALGAGGKFPGGFNGAVMNEAYHNPVFFNLKSPGVAV